MQLYSTVQRFRKPMEEKKRTLVVVFYTQNVLANALGIPNKLLQLLPGAADECKNQQQT